MSSQINQLPYIVTQHSQVGVQRSFMCVREITAVVVRTSEACSSLIVPDNHSQLLNRTVTLESVSEKLGSVSRVQSSLQTISGKAEERHRPPRHSQSEDSNTLKVMNGRAHLLRQCVTHHHLGHKGARMHRPKIVSVRQQTSIQSSQQTNEKKYQPSLRGNSQNGMKGSRADLKSLHHEDIAVSPILCNSCKAVVENVSLVAHPRTRPVRDPNPSRGAGERPRGMVTTSAQYHRNRSKLASDIQLVSNDHRVRQYRIATRTCYPVGESDYLVCSECNISSQGRSIIIACELEPQYSLAVRWWCQCDTKQGCLVGHRRDVTSSDTLETLCTCRASHAHVSIVATVSLWSSWCPGLERISQWRGAVDALAAPAVQMRLWIMVSTGVSLFSVYSYYADTLTLPFYMRVMPATPKWKVEPRWQTLTHVVCIFGRRRTVNRSGKSSSCPPSLTDSLWQMQSATSTPLITHSNRGLRGGAPNLKRAQAPAYHAADEAAQRLHRRVRQVISRKEGTTTQCNTIDQLWRQARDAKRVDDSAGAPHNIQGVKVASREFDDRTPQGLINIGNSCFMNAVLQCLVTEPTLAQWIRKHAQQQSRHPQHDVHLLVHILQSTGDINVEMALNQLLHTVEQRYGWQHKRQQDAAEFVMWCLAALYSPQNPLHEHEGQRSATCTQCTTEFHKTEMFSLLAINPDTCSSIQEGIDVAQQPQLLKCPNCEANTLSTPFGVWVTAQMLWIHIERNADQRKNTKYIFPDAVVHIGQQFHYRLTGVVIHEGPTPHNGHYYSYVRRPDDNWYQLNDNAVTTLANISRLSPQVYLALYSHVESHHSPTALLLTPQFSAQVAAVNHQTAPVTQDQTLACAEQCLLINVPRCATMLTQELGRYIQSEGHQHKLRYLSPTAVEVNCSQEAVRVNMANSKQIEERMLQSWKTRQIFSRIYLSSWQESGESLKWLESAIAVLLPFLARKHWVSNSSLILLDDTPYMRQLLNKNWINLHAYVIVPPVSCNMQGIIQLRCEMSTNAVITVRQQPFSDGHQALLPTATAPCMTAVDQLPRAVITRASHNLVGLSADGRLSIHTTVEQFLSTLTPTEITCLLHPDAQRIDQLSILKRETHKHYAIQLHLAEREVSEYGSGTPGLGHCALQALHQIFRRSVDGDQVGGIAGAYPTALNLRVQSERAEYVQWIDQLMVSGTTEAQLALTRIKQHVLSTDYSPHLPTHLWFDGTFFRNLALQFPLNQWMLREHTRGTCTLTTSSLASTARYGSLTFQQLETILSVKGNILYARRHFCPIPDFTHGQCLLDSALERLLDTLIEYLRNTTQQAEVHNDVIDLVSESSAESQGTRALQAVVTKQVRTELTDLISESSGVAPESTDQRSTAASQTVGSQSAPRSSGQTLITRTIKRKQPDHVQLYPPERSGCIHPTEVTISQNQHLNNLTKVVDAQQFGGKSLVATRKISTDTVIGIYGGIFTDRLQCLTDTYLVQGCINGRNVVVDGKPTDYCLTDFTKFGYINEYIGHMDCNVRLTHDLRLVATRNITNKDHLFLNYGDDYNWNPVIISKNLKLLCLVLRQLGDQYGKQYAPEITELLDRITNWDEKALSVAYNSLQWQDAFIARVLRGHLKPEQRHLHHLTGTVTFDDWLEMTLSSEVVYRNVAFRYANHPERKYVPSLDLLREKTQMPMVDRRRASTRVKYTKVKTLQLNSDDIEMLAPYPGVTWKKRLDLNTLQPEVKRTVTAAPHADETPWYIPATSDDGPVSPTSTPSVTYVDVITRLKGQPTATKVHPVEMLAADFLAVASVSRSKQADHHSSHHHQMLVQEASRAREQTPDETNSTAEVPEAAPEVCAVAGPTSRLESDSPVSSDTHASERHWHSQWGDDFLPPVEEDCGPRAGSPDSGMTFESDDEATECSEHREHPKGEDQASSQHHSQEQGDNDIRRLNELADKLAPQRRSRQGHERWLNTYIHNVGGLTNEKMTDIGEVLRAKCCDVVVLLDARISLKQVPSTIAAFKRLLIGFHVVVYPTTVALNGTRVGGAIVLTSPRVRQKSIHQLSPVGTLVEITGAVGTTQFALHAVYVPQKPTLEATGALYAKVEAELNEREVDVLMNPYDHLKDQLHQAVTKNLADQRLIIVGGDFNSSLCAPGDTHGFGELFSALELRTAESENGLARPTYINGKTHTRIDHIVTSDPTQVRMVAIYRSLYFQTDHAALIASFQVSTTQSLHARWTLPLQQLRKAQFDGANVQQKAEIAALLATLTVDSTAPPGARLQSYTTQTMSIIKEARGVHKPHRHKLCKFWCPENVALEIYLRLAVDIRTLQKRQRFSIERLETLVVSAELRLRRLAKDDLEQAASFALLTVFNTEFWKPKLPPTGESITLAAEAAYSGIKKLLYHSLRKQRRREFTKLQLQLALNLQVGRLRSVIQYAIGSKKKAFQLETLTVDGVTITDPGTIAYSTKGHFTDWFAPKYPKTIPCWFHILTDRAAFFRHARSKQVPEQYIRVIWKAVSYRPPDNSQRHAFQAAVQLAPSLEKFEKALRHAPKNTAGGISGLTYDIMRQWPDAVIKDVYLACCELWETKAVPVEWTRRWVHLIPKVDNPSLDELRPICLLEVIRKLWVGLVVETISEYIYSDGVLTSGQQSGKGRGTDAGSAELSATLETAKRCRSQLYMSSWDVKRAFDSVARGILLFSWERLGVPTAVAQYLIALDAEAVMVVKNPLTLLIEHEFGYEGLVRHGLTFHPQQGTPQGGNEASLGYIGFSDILLRSLVLMGTSDYLTLDTNEQLNDTFPNAYVDDLNSVSSTLEQLQQKADVVSAFCCIFCITLNAGKFRAFHVNWGNALDQHDQSILTVHTDGWVPTPVTLANDGSVTHLGVTRDCNVEDTVQFYDLYAKTSVALTKLTQANVSVAAKLMILKTVIYPRIRYIGKAVCWKLKASQASYAQFDSLVFAAVRRITQNRPSYPTALIESPTTLGGLGIPRVSVDCQLAKLADMRRAMMRTEPHKRTMLTLVNNVFKATNQPLVARQVSLTSVAGCDTWWFSSAVEFVQSLGLTITVNQPTAPASTVLLQNMYPDMSEESKRVLFLMSIATHQEL